MEVKFYFLTFKKHKMSKKQNLRKIDLIKSTIINLIMSIFSPLFMALNTSVEYCHWLVY